MNSGYKVEYSSDLDEICIIPWPHIPMDDMIALLKMYEDQGYAWWQPADDRRGYVFTKTQRRKECPENAKSAENIP